MKFQKFLLSVSCSLICGAYSETVNFDWHTEYDNQDVKVAAMPLTKGQILIGVPFDNKFQF